MKSAIKWLHDLVKQHLIFAAMKGYPWYRMFLSAITQGMALDTEKYLPYLKETSLSDEQKKAVIRTTWRLMENQVQQAFTPNSYFQDNTCTPKLKAKTPSSESSLNHH